MSQAGIISISSSSGIVDSVTGTNGVIASPTTGNVVVSGVDATTSTVGVASFNPADFTVTSGEVSLIAVGGVTSVTGTANQILATPTTGDVVLSLVGPYTPATYTAHSVLVGEGTSSIVGVGPTVNAGTVLQSNIGADPSYSQASYPSSTLTHQILYSSSANVIAGLATANNGVLITSASGVPSILANGNTNQVLTATTGSPPSWAAPLTTIVTIDGDSGSVTGNTIRLYGNSGSANAGSSVKFSGSTNEMDLIVTDSNNNTIVGAHAGNSSISGSSNSALGAYTLNALTSGVSNCAFGQNALSSLQSTSYNTAIGNYSLSLSTTDSGNVAIGYQSMNSATGGSNNVCVGNQSGYTMTSSYNCAIGNGVLQHVTGSYNSILGQESAVYITSGQGNSIVGQDCLNNGSATSASYNAALGIYCLQSILTGNYNIAIGYQAGNNYTGSESSNILLNALGTASENNVMRLGTAGTGNGQVSTCYIAGISGVTVTGTAVLCSTSGQLGTIASSERYKENIKDIDEKTSVLKLRPVEFNYKSDEYKTKSYGLIAEEVDKDFPYLCFYKDDKPESVKYHELPVLLLKEIQKLNKRIEELEKRKCKCR